MLLFNKYVFLALNIYKIRIRRCFDKWNWNLKLDKCNKGVQDIGMKYHIGFLPCVLSVNEHWLVCHILFLINLAHVQNQYVNLLIHFTKIDFTHLDII